MELKVLTINCWGLYTEAKNVLERFKHIAEEVKRYDVACLQEVWSRKDYEDLVTRLSSALPYSHHFLNSSYIGSGLCIFSKYPIVSVITHQFRVTSGIRLFYDGEVFCGKGVLCCVVETPQGNVAVFNTHLNPRCRESQIFEILQLVHNVRGDNPVIVCGDFNTKDSHTAYHIMTECLGLSDVYSDEPDVKTCDLSTNIYTKLKMKDKPKRIDFIFHSDPLVLVSRNLALTGLIPGKDFPYSDHEGVEAVFTLNSRQNSLTKNKYMSSKGLRILHTVSEEIRLKRDKHFKPGSFKHAGLFILGLILSTVVVIVCLAKLSATFPDYRVYWITTPLGMMYGIFIMLLFVFFVNENNLHGGMKANIDEINSILFYHRFKPT